MDIFNTLRLFTKEPIKEQEIKLEFLNLCQCFIVLKTLGWKDGTAGGNGCIPLQQRCDTYAG